MVLKTIKVTTTLLQVIVIVILMSAIRIANINKAKLSNFFYLGIGLYFRMSIDRLDMCSKHADYNEICYTCAMYYLHVLTYIVFYCFLFVSFNVRLCSNLCCCG